MTKIRTGNGASKWLKEHGFSPVADCRRKVAGCIKEWTSEDGRKATVGYELYTRTGQSSLGAAAVWGYAVYIQGAA